MMRNRAIYLVWVAFAGAGCSAASTDSGYPPAKDAAALDMGKRDAPSATADSGGLNPMPPNVFGDAPVYNWQCPGCAGSSGKQGGSTGTGTGQGGAMGTGGQGGAGGGSTQLGSGGSMDADAGIADALPADASRETAVEAGIAPDSAGLPDTITPCLAEIVPVVPYEMPSSLPLVATPNTKIVLRAKVNAGAIPASASWSWQAYAGGSTLPPAETNPTEPADAAFLITKSSDYTFTASAGTCLATFRLPATQVAPGYADDRGMEIRIVSPPSYGLPVESGYYSYNAAISLRSARTVRLFASVGNSRVPAYLRINTDDVRVTDGYVDSSVDFIRPLLELGGGSGGSNLMRYDVLVVPLDGSDGRADGAAGATAPQVFSNLTLATMERDGNFRLSGGATVTGSVLGSDGQGTSDARVVLSSQARDGSTASGNLLFSSIGLADAQGAFTLHAQPGNYWIYLSPPRGSGLPEAASTQPIGLGGDATFRFSWAKIGTAPLSVQVLDAKGNPAGSTHVIVSSSLGASVGTFTYTSSAGTITDTLAGNLQLESVADAKTGIATFKALPAPATYSVLLVPAAYGASAATTTLTIDLATSGVTTTARLSAEASISGQLAGTTALGGAPDWTKVSVVAIDKSKLAPEPMRSVFANPDGSFALGVSPNRPYLVLAWPDASSGLARTVVGPGYLQGSPFKTTQKVQASLDWSSSVSLTQNGLAMPIVGAALQGTCNPTYPGCIDPTVPLAEATSGPTGTFVMKVPDPSTR